MKTGILIVSFGTSFAQSRKKSIQRLEKDFQMEYPDAGFYYAYTSNVIRNIIFEKEGLQINDVKMALEQMLKDQITDIMVQPTHIIDGIENHRMKEEIETFKEKFHSIKIGKPLLSDQKDYELAVSAVMEPLLPELDGETAVLFMGHGTSHEVNHCYEVLNQTFQYMGYEQVLVGTVEALPDLNELMRRLENKQKKYQRIVIQPFMLVAGDHAYHDMAGENPKSWKTILEQKGYKVTCRIEGIGENQKIRGIYLQHGREAQ